MSRSGYVCKPEQLLQFLRIQQNILYSVFEDVDIEDARNHKAATRQPLEKLEPLLPSKARGLDTKARDNRLVVEEIGRSIFEARCGK